MKSLTIYLMVFLSQTVYSQGEFIERGQNAYSGGVSLVINSKAYGLGVSGAMSIYGTLDFGLSYALIVARHQPFNTDPLSRAFSPFAGVHIIKQSESFPVSFSATVQYQTQTFYSPSHDQSSDYNFLTYAGSLYSAFQVSPLTFLQPSCTISTTKQVADNNRIVLQEQLQAVELGISVVVKSKESRSIFLPSVTLSKNEPTYTLSFLFIGLFSDHN